MRAPIAAAVPVAAQWVPGAAVAVSLRELRIVLPVPVAVADDVVVLVVDGCVGTVMEAVGVVMEVERDTRERRLPSMTQDADHPRWMAVVSVLEWRPGEEHPVHRRRIRRH